MTAAEIASLSIRTATKTYSHTLNTNVVEKIALSLVAQWLIEQDESIDPATVLATFNEAARLVRFHFC